MVDASVIGWVSGELVEPPPDALSSFVGYASGTLVEPLLVSPSMIGAVSGTLTAGGAWAPTTVTLSNQTLVVIARDPGQTLTCGTQQVISYASSALRACAPSRPAGGTSSPS